MSELIPSFIDVTPFGPYCKLCDVPLAVQRGIFHHGKKAHPEISFKNASVVRECLRKIDSLRSTHSNDLSSFLKESSLAQTMWFCTVCFVAHNRKSNFQRHFELRSNTCSGGISGQIDCYPTICGRFGPKSCNIPVAAVTPRILTIGTAHSTVTETSLPAIAQNLNAKSSSKVPSALMITQDDAISILTPFVRADENVSDLCLIYYPLLNPGFEGTMREYLAYSASQPDEDILLSNWIEAGRLWLTKYAAGHIANVSANVRSRLAEFEQKELDGVTFGSRTFTLRRGIPRLFSELESALRFFYHFPTTLFDEYKADHVKTADLKSMIETAIIPKILYTAIKEEPDDHGKLPVVCQFALSRGFTTKGGTQLQMNECGWFSSRISALMHLLRAGVCGYLVTLSGNGNFSFLTLQEMEIVGNVQNGRVTNLLSPYVKRLRELNARKPPIKNNTVNVNGDITSGAFTFPKTVWSTLIPRVVEICKLAFTEIFDSEKWIYFLNESLTMADWVHLDVTVIFNNNLIRLSELQVKKNIEAVLAKLQSVGELCLFGLGVGAVRHEEVVRLQVYSTQWHNNYVYFWSESLKQGSMKKSSTPKLVAHRLSLTLSRVFLLIRYALTASQIISDNQLLSDLKGSSMLGLIRDIFDFDHHPEMLHVRHLFTSIGNVISPETFLHGNDFGVVSTSVLTEKSGHTQGTGRRTYSTWLENSEEALFDLYHRNLGESSLDPPVIEFTPFSESILTASLRELLGRKAVYRSKKQHEMVQIAANSILRHAFVGLPCGQGKSLSWLVPMMAAYLSGRHVGLRIVILPYKFLLGHMVQHALSLIGLLADKLTVKFLDSSQISKEIFPEILQDNLLPSLLFLNLDSAATLLRYHLAGLKLLVSRNILKRVFIDEFQQFLPEFGFRFAFQSLRDLGRLGVPVMCLSGSLPLSLATSLMNYCGLLVGSPQDSIDIVHSSDPIGDGFSFNVEIVPDIVDAIVKYVHEKRVGACHVICSTKSLVEQISTALSKTYKVLFVTGDTPYSDQIRCASDWFKGEYEILVSTVIALVGNENRHCKTIVIGGFLYNVSSLVQAFGRLRPEQRGPDSKVQYFRLPFHSKDRQNATNESENSFSELKTAMSLTEDTKTDFIKIFSPIGLQHILSMKSGCYLKELSMMYGFARLNCTSCTLCLKPSDQANNEEDTGRKRTVADSDSSFPTKRSKSCAINCIKAAQTISNEISKEERKTRRSAEEVFCELLYRCLACERADCNGECVKGCFRCGDRYHRTNVCSFNVTKLTAILSGKGVCFGCFDTRQRGMIDHNIRECPTQRRLKRILFLDRERKGTGFEAYLRSLYASETSFLTMVASFSSKVKLGRCVENPL